MAREPQRRSAPTRAQLIHRLIEERARSIAKQRALGNVIVLTECRDTDQARREIEREILSQTYQGIPGHPKSMTGTRGP